MTISSVSYWRGGEDEDVATIAGRAKAVVTKHGAERYELMIVNAGPEAGQWIIIISYRNWESYGRAMEALAHDPEIHALVAEMTAISELTSHRIVASIDL
jgi:hypothetical protein